MATRLLTSSLTGCRHLPIRQADSGGQCLLTHVSGYSGGTVPEFHRVPLVATGFVGHALPTDNLKGDFDQAADDLFRRKLVSACSGSKKRPSCPLPMNKDWGTRPDWCFQIPGNNAALLSLKVFDNELDGIPRTPCGIPANRGQSAEKRGSNGDLPNRHDPHGF